MQYNDGKYHIELITHTYLGGYEYPGWTLVNTFGEMCRKNGRTIVFNDQDKAQKYCDKLNMCPDGGIITNME